MDARPDSGFIRATARIVIFDSWCAITIRATVEDGRGG